LSARRADAWQLALDLAEADLRQRERQALEGEPTPQELRAFATERDKLATDRAGLADAYDEQARERDTVAFSRDVRGSNRDRDARGREDDLDVGALDRFVAGADRDFAAGDRADDLQREIDGLREAQHTRLLIGQAEGQLMARYNLEPAAAFRLLVRLSQEGHLKLHVVAARLVADAAQQAHAGAGADDRGAPTTD
jgi:hypothetical protein